MCCIHVYVCRYIIACRACSHILNKVKDLLRHQRRNVVIQDGLETNKNVLRSGDLKKISDFYRRKERSVAKRYRETRPASNREGCNSNCEDEWSLATPSSLWETP